MPAQRHINCSLKPSIINAAKPQEKAFVLTDGGGLYIEVMAGGSKVWRYSYRIDGRRPKLTIGPYPQIGIAQARDAHEGMRALVGQGIDPASEKKAKEELAQRSVTFREFSLVWLVETMTHLSENYRMQTIRFLDSYICREIGKCAWTR